MVAHFQGANIHKPNVRIGMEDYIATQTKLRGVLQTPKCTFLGLQLNTFQSFLWLLRILYMTVHFIVSK